MLKLCLEKDPENRWQSAKDLKAELEWIATGETEVQQLTKSRPSWIAWAVATAAVIVAIGFGFVHFRETPPSPLPLRLWVALPEFSAISELDLSPDGRTIVISGTRLAEQGRQLYLRAPRFCGIPSIIEYCWRTISLLVCGWALHWLLCRRKAQDCFRKRRADRRFAIRE